MVLNPIHHHPTQHTYAKMHHTTSFRRCRHINPTHHPKTRIITVFETDSIEKRIPTVIITCGFLSVELAHSSLCDREDIFMIHLIIIIKSEVWTYPIVVIFLRGCVPEVVVPSYAVASRHIYNSGTAGFCFFHYCAGLWCAQIIEYIMAWWSYLFVCRLYYLIIIIMQTYLKVLKLWNACRVHSGECVLRFSQFAH